MSNDNPFASPQVPQIGNPSPGASSWARPQATGGVHALYPVGVWRLRGKLVMHRSARLPDRCVKTNAPAEAWLTRKLFWYHPLILLALLLNLIVFLVLVLVLGKKAVIQVGIARGWRNRHRWRAAFAWSMTLLLPGACIAGAFVSDEAWMPWLVAGAFLAFLLGAVVSVLVTRIVWPVRITDQYVVLKGVHPAFLAELPDWPYPGSDIP